MKLTVLIDNNTLIDRYFQGEPGLCFFIQENQNILFDLGYSDTFIRNAYKLGINLLQTDKVILSHGHLDHTWGLDPLIRLQTEALIENIPVKRPKIIAHPLIFNTRSVPNLPQIGSLISQSKAVDVFDLELSKKPIWLSRNLVFLGEIERKLDFEPSYAMGSILDDDQNTHHDFLHDDSALVYKSKQGLVIIVGCSHSGICNTIEQAKKVCNEQKVCSIIGGLHLLDPHPDRLHETINYLKYLNLVSIYACHCTDLKSKVAIAQYLPLQEVGVGMNIEFK